MMRESTRNVRAGLREAMAAFRWGRGAGTPERTTETCAKLQGALERVEAAEAIAETPGARAACMRARRELSLRALSRVGAPYVYGAEWVAEFGPAGGRYDYVRITPERITPAALRVLEAFGCVCVRSGLELYAVKVPHAAGVAAVFVSEGVR